MDILKRVIISTGSNLGNRLFELRAALGFLSQEVGKCLHQSSIYESAAVGFESSSAFLNQILVIETKFSAYEVLDICLRYEQSRGRIRKHHEYADRPIDLDIIDFNGEIFDTSRLVLPHPRAFERPFVLVPLWECCPDYRIPGSQKLLFEGEHMAKKLAHYLKKIEPEGF